MKHTLTTFLTATDFSGSILMTEWSLKLHNGFRKLKKRENSFLTKLNAV